MAIVRHLSWICILPLAIGVVWFWFGLAFFAQQSLLISFLSSLATVLGALAFLFLKKTKTTPTPWFLGISGGMMAGAAVFSLLFPAGSLLLENPLLSLALAMLVALFLGAFLMQKIDKITPHEHIENLSNRPTFNVFLIASALILHNAPEGMAQGIASDLTITWGIALQNIPEGALLAGMLASCSMPKNRVVLWALLSAGVEFLGALVGIFLNVFLNNTADFLLPLSLVFAAGAMLWVFFHEMIPAFKGIQSHAGFVLGIATMALLLVFLG